MTYVLVEKYILITHSYLGSCLHVRVLAHSVARSGVYTLDNNFCVVGYSCEANIDVYPDFNIGHIKV